MEEPQFNLWADPWLDVEGLDGRILPEKVSLSHLLRHAHEYRTLYDPSPLVIVAIHRHLVAILQEMIDPQVEEDELLPLWETGRFPADKITAFGDQYHHRFDLFSESEPFMQTADEPLIPDKRGKGKPVGYLFQEQPAGTATTHYNHAYDDAYRLCATCAAKGVLTIPAFASSGGSGIKPAINGVPPIYIIPSGKTLFMALLASLTVGTDDYQPTDIPLKDDTPWWRHSPIIKLKHELNPTVGYLHGLTFPARRVRLHPERMKRPCSRCGETMAWGVGEMVYQMGESRPKNAPLWRDPFAAYRIKKDTPPIPIRPVEERAVWREFAGLFLPSRTITNEKKQIGWMRPAILDQIDLLQNEGIDTRNETGRIPCRVVGLRTDMKMKIFEWSVSEFALPPAVLSSHQIATNIETGLEFARSIDGIAKRIFKKWFGGETGDEKHINLKKQMIHTYWVNLEPYFREWIYAFDTDDIDDHFADWLQTVCDVMNAAFQKTAAQVGDDAAALEQRVQAISHCTNAVMQKRETVLASKQELTDDN